LAQNPRPSVGVSTSLLITARRHGDDSGNGGRVVAGTHINYFVGGRFGVNEALTKTHQFAFILQRLRPNPRRSCDHGT
jgi:hypothetical protein